MQPEPVRDIAHLGHVEVLTPKFEESRKFFIDVMGMTQSGEKGDSVYLRAWDDYERYSLKLTASKTSGMGHAAFRTRSPQALERRAAALKGSGFDVGWSDGDLGHGKTFVCKDPDGHVIELYYETEWYDPPPDQKPALKNQAQRYPARGCNVRRIDHFNGLAVDIKANREFFENFLGFMLTEQIVLDDGSEAGMWMTATNKSYDFAYTRDHTGNKGRFHHVTYALDSREDVLRAADVFLEHGVFIETGPHKHAIQQTFFLYVYEPGGNRVEVACPGARLVLAPDWKPIRWTEAERKKGQAWGLQTIKSFHTHGTPPVPGVPELLTAPMSDVLHADRALVVALAKGDARAAMLDDEFTWVDVNGRVLDQTQAAAALPKPPLGDEAGLTPAVHRYGAVATVATCRDKVFVLRIWVKREAGWRLLSYHEVSQNLPSAPHGPGRKEWDNPCYVLPYAPRNADERDCLAAWQQLEIAVMHHQPDVWAEHVADEFLVVGAARRHGKTDRKAVIDKQRRTDANSAPAPLVSARLFGFTDAMVMLCEHQPFHGKAARVSRVFVKRGGRWLMAVSFQTTRQDAEVKTI